MLQLKNVVKNYPTATTTVQALRGVSLDFRESEFVAILGPSGCGKTTMLNIIGGLDRYTSGDLVIGGISTATFDDQHWDAYRNATIGFVFQSYNLIPHLTVVENVEMALCLIGVKKKERRAKAVEALQCVGMGNEINKRPNQLSGGQMQRVAIARAIVNDPKIILADEPTGALDSELSVQVMDILSELAKTRLVIMVTHNAELAYEYCSRICRFKDGQLISDSNPYDSGYTPIPEVEQEYEPAETYAEGGAESATTDTLSLNEHDTTVDSVTEKIADEQETVEHSTFDHGDEDEHDDGIDVDEMYAEKPTRVKKVSNHKRKKVMKNIGVRDNEAFNRLGLNSGMKKKKTPQNRKDKSFKPTSMSAGMAFGLSLRNLISKRGRTIFTAFAGSIGIIGLGLVLSIRTGFHGYVGNMETELAAGKAMGMYEYNVDVSMMDEMTSMLTQMGAELEKGEGDFPTGDDIIVNAKDEGGSTNQMMESMGKLIGAFLGKVYSNSISEDFANYLAANAKDKNGDPNYDVMSVYYGLRYNLITKIGDEYKDISTSPAPSLVRNIMMNIFGQPSLQDPNWQLLVGGKDQMLEKYTIIDGEYPEHPNELLLCVNKNNSINQTLLDAFGLTFDKETLECKDFIGKTFKLVYNDAYYNTDYMDYEDWGEGLKVYNPKEDIYQTGTNPGEERIIDQGVLGQLFGDEDTDNGMTLKIVGVIRVKEGVSADYISSGICYTPELQQLVLDKAYDSDIAEMQRKWDEFCKAHPDMENLQGMTALGIAGHNVTLADAELKADSATDILKIFTDSNFGNMYTSFLRCIGAEKSPVYINVYPMDYDQKQAVQGLIDDWKAKHLEAGEQIGFLDISAMITKTLDQIINLVTYLLLAVAAISLVVSTAMIGVITSNSVVERTREIGILRSLGARKKDIRSIFIAETTLIGLTSGLLGIVVTYILSPLISLVLESVTTGVLKGTMLMFDPLHALLLVVLSTVLTIISGVVPAVMASRKNVVDALRVE